MSTSLSVCKPIPSERLISEPSIIPENSNVCVSVIVLIYNRSDNLTPLIERVTEVLDQEPYPYEIICVDDGFKDGSTERLQELTSTWKNLCAIIFRRNYGQTAAMAAGFEHAQGQVMVTLDGDLQNDPRDIPQLLSKMAEGYDLVSEWRKHRQDHVLTRLLPSKIANWLIRKVTDVRLHDYGRSLKAYRAELVADMNSR